MKYLVTDPCYVVPSEPHQEWLDFLDLTEYGESLPKGGFKIEGLGTIIDMGGTCGGDGTWHVGNGKQQVFADAGLVCIVELEDENFDKMAHGKEKGYHPNFTLGAITDNKEEAKRWMNHVQTFDPWG